VIARVSEAHGLTAQLRYRGYDSRREDVDGAYFNPGRYRQALAVLAMRKRIEGWTLRAEAGSGREWVDGRERPAHAAQLQLEGRLEGGARVAVRASWLRSAGSIVDDPDYAWRYAGIVLTVPLR